uniref:Sas10 domain-containing protein n=1 Tax=Steinernema glaseri TaxID=37863 RepID=A0A1I7ZCJ4_9BILA
MGKRRGGNKQHKKLQHERAADDAGHESDEIYDEVDRFNNERNATSTDLTRRKQHKVEEVLNVEADEFSDDQEEVDGDFDDSDDEEMEGGEGADLPSANKWGNKRSEFYGTSYVDEDWGGVNASDEEAIDLEEEDAIARQKKLDAALASIDYGEAELHEDDAEMQESEENVVDDSSPGQMLEIFQARRPEYQQMVEEYKDKKALLKSTVVPLKKLLELMGHEDFPLRKEIEAVVYLSTSYFANLVFYIHYVHSLGLEELAEVTKHPVIEQIIKIKKYLNEAENLIDFNERQFRKVCSSVEENKVKSAVKILARIAGKLPAKTEKPSKMVENEDEEFTGEGGDTADVVEDDEKRKITYEIEKNKGLTAKRKKNKKHSRIQKRVQFRKAVVKRRSQVPDVRRETSKYAGEARGIRASTVKSIKLKA